MNCGIYAIFDKKTSECLYVGQSRDIKARWKRHISLLRRSSHLENFNKWFLNAGRDIERLGFSFLEICENDDLTLNNAEIKWFNDLSPRFYGKSPSVNDKWAHSDETRAKIAQKVAGYHAKRSSSKAITEKIAEEKICISCKKQFTTKRIDKKYCSDSCRRSLKKCLNCDNYVMYSHYTFCISCSPLEKNRRYPLAQISDEDFLNFYDIGLSSADISRKFNVSRAAVTRHKNKILENKI